MTTHVQTVDVYPADSSMMFQTQMLAPVFPSSVYKSDKYPDYFVSSTMDKYMLYPDGRIECLCANGDTQVWWPKPTLADSICYSNTCTLFEFKSNGTVNARLGIHTYMWGPSTHTAQPLDGTHTCEDCFYSSREPHKCLSYQTPIFEYDSEEYESLYSCKYRYRRHFW